MDNLYNAELVTKLAKSCITSHLGFPHFSADYVRRYIERPETEASELQEYKATIRAPRWLCAALIISSLSFSCCALAVVAVQMNELNFKDPERNLVPLVVSPNLNDSSTTPKHRFNCLATNCTTRLKAGLDESGSLANDLLELPQLALCHPILSFFQERTQLLVPIGILFNATLVLVVVICSFVFALFQNSLQAPNLLLMFLVAPKVTRRVVYDRARELYDEIRTSRVNCEQNHQFMLQRAAGQSANFRCSFYSSLRQAPALPVEIFTDAHDDDENYVHEFANDCVSIMRSDWWHFKALRAFHRILAPAWANVTFLWVFFYIITLIQVRRLQARLTQAGQQADVNNCTIWIEDESCTMPYDGSNLPGYRRLDLATYQLQTHPLGAMLFTAQYTWSIVPASIFMVIYLFVTAELFTWLYEIKFQLRLASECLRQLSDRCKLKSYKNRQHEVVQSFQLEQWRILYASLTQSRFSIFVEHHKFGRLEESRMRTTNSRFKSSVAIETFVAQSIEHQQLQLGAALELLEKLHVSFRLFVEHVHHYGPTMTIFIGLITLHTYTLAVISIGYIRHVSERDPFPFVMMVSSWIFINLLLWLASSFHAQAKELQPTIWSLLAVLALNVEHNARSRHVHCLWLKQVTALDRDRGLSLRAFNLSITYIRSIQLVLGSATLITLALR